MDNERKYFHVTLDMKRNGALREEFEMRHNDDNELVIKLIDEEGTVDLNAMGITRTTLLITRSDKQDIPLDGSITPEGYASFKLKRDSLAKRGLVEAVAQFYFGEDVRISTPTLIFNALRDPAAGNIGEEGDDKTLIEIILEDGPHLLAQLQTAYDELQTQKAAFAQFQEDSDEAFLNAQNQRASDFDSAQTQRNADFTSAQTQRNTDFNESQTQRANEFTADQESRDTQFDTAQTERQSDYVTWKNQKTGEIDAAVLNAESSSAQAFEDAAAASAAATLANEAAGNADDARIALQTEIDEYFAQLQVGADTQTAIYGVYHDGGSNPVMTRIKGAAGKVAAVGVDGQLVQNDFDNAQIFGEIGDVTDSLGNVFVRIPKHYFRHRQGRNPDGTLWQIDEVSKTQHAGFILYPCFYDYENNVELPYVDVGKYLAGYDGTNRMTSKRNEYPRVSQSIVAFRNAAVANNADGRKGYQLWDLHAIDMLQRLFMIEFATLNSQSVMSGFSTGQYSDSHIALNTEAATNQVVLPNAQADLFRVGQSIGIGTSRGANNITGYRTITAINVVDVNNKALVFDGAPLAITAGNFVYNTAFKTGSTDNIAAASGSPVSNTDGKQAMKYRGVESLWGDVFQFVDGVNINEFQAWTCDDARFYASNLFAAPYKQLGYINQANEGYVKEMGYDPTSPTARFPVQVGASASTWYSDYYYRAAGQRVALFGGAWYSGALAGLFYWHLSYSSSAATLTVGARLLKKAL